MGIKFLVDEYDNGAKFLVEEIRRQGYICDFVDYQSILNDPSCIDAAHLPKNKGNFSSEDIILFQGSIQMALWLKRNRPVWYPLVWLTEDNYKCSTYYPKLNEYILNKDYVFLSSDAVSYKKDMLFGIFGDKIFIRPDSGLKSFTGKLFDKSTFDIDWRKETYNIHNQFVLISSFKEIVEEYRFVCTKGSIVTGCKYTSTDILDFNTDYTTEAYELCKRILSQGYYPDEMFTIDICKTKDNKYHLLELNSFSCAGLYDCDLEKIVKEMVRIVRK